MGVVTLERVFPMMLGANIGTTSTAILAAFSATGDRIVPSFQIAMCHLFFNLSGILLWYPVPFMRRVPLKLARCLGKTTAKYRWFAFMYLLMMFFVLPFSVFLLSIPGWWLLAAVLIPIILIAITIGIINVIQNKRPEWLPAELRNWEFLPLCLRSLEPLDSKVTALLRKCNCCGCCDKILNPHGHNTEDDDEEKITINGGIHNNNENEANDLELKTTLFAVESEGNETVQNGTVQSNDSEENELSTEGHTNIYNPQRGGHSRSSSSASSLNHENQKQNGVHKTGATNSKSNRTARPKTDSKSRVAKPTHGSQTSLHSMSFESAI